MIDGDSQSSLTISLGNPQPDKLPVTLSGMEVSLVNAMSWETILRQYLDTVKRDYTHILIDCQPSLDMLKVNANRVLIPVQPINPKLQIDGILLTMVDSRTNFANDISALLRDTYGSKIMVFATDIPHSVRASELAVFHKRLKNTQLHDAIMRSKGA